MPFADILGQEDAARSLQSAVRRARVANAYLFRGPEGVGKAKMALEFAKLLSCEKPTGEPCGRCHPCELIEAGTYPDVHIVGPADGGRCITVGQVRETNRAVFLYPTLGKWKIFIIRDADDLRDDAQNMMLKTLEEPPGDTVIILLAARPHRLFSTIPSRCQALRFRPLPLRHLDKILERIAPDEPKEARSFAAAYAAGSAAAARRALAAQGPAVRDHLVELIAKLRPGAAFPIAADIYERVASAAKEKQLEDQREAMRFYLDVLARLYRDMIIVAAGVAEVPLFNADRRALIEEMAGRTGLSAAARSAGWLLDGRANIDRNANIRLALEDSLCRVAQLVGTSAAAP